MLKPMTKKEITTTLGLEPQDWSRVGYTYRCTTHSAIVHDMRDKYMLSPQDSEWVALWIGHHLACEVGRGLSSIDDIIALTLEPTDLAKVRNEVLADTDPVLLAMAINDIATICKELMDENERLRHAIDGDDDESI